VFRKGDIIEWCDEKYEVIEVNGNIGRVKVLGTNEIIRNFKFDYGGEIARKLKERK